MSEGGGAVGLRGGGLCGAELAGRRLVLDGALGEAALGERLPAHLPQLRPLRRLPPQQHGAGVVPDLVAVADAEPRGAGRRDDVLAVGTPGEVGGVRSLGFGDLRRKTLVTPGGARRYCSKQV